MVQSVLWVGPRQRAVPAWWGGAERRGETGGARVSRFS